MGKTDDYRQVLRARGDWEPFLLAESGLPGPRGNLELVQAVADEGDEALFRRFLSYRPEQTPEGTALEFLPVCGTVGLGRLLAEGRLEALDDLRRLAADPRWRVREGVAMALQRLGDRDMDRLLVSVAPWAQGSPWEQRAAAAGLCEPRLLHEAAHARAVLQILDEITTRLAAAQDRRSEAFKTLRKGLAYCWSVAVVALPDEGKPAMEKWLACRDRDVAWIMKENLKKNRLARLDAAWVERCLQIATSSAL